MSTPTSSADSEQLLSAVNDASDRTASLHLAFVALCAYVLVIVLGTTDTDLLIGKGVRLPLLDVEVPIVGFFVCAPLLLVVAHFNLLVQFLVLARKLGALRASARATQFNPARLHSFSIIYVVGDEKGGLGRNVIACAALVSTVVLPLIVLGFALARFLSYQSPLITWAQRGLIWADVLALALLWPIVRSPDGRWKTNFRNLAPRSQRWGATMGASCVSFAALTAWATTGSDTWTHTVLGSAALTAAIISLVFCGRMFAGGSTTSIGEHSRWNFDAFGLLVILALGVALPISLRLDGEWIDAPGSPMARATDWLRHIDLHDRNLVNPQRPETRSELLEAIDPARRDIVINRIPPLDLRYRSFRGANFRHAFLPNADLRRADLARAKFDAAVMERALLGEANLSEAKLRQTKLNGARAEGADLSGADLRCSDLSEAHFECADLTDALLNGSLMAGAHFDGATMIRAKLKHAKLDGVRLDGATMKHAELYLTKSAAIQTTVVDLEEMHWNPMSIIERDDIIYSIPEHEIAPHTWWAELKSILGSPVPSAANPALLAPDGAPCRLAYSDADYKDTVVPGLARLARQSLYAATGLIRNRAPALPKEYRATLASILLKEAKEPSSNVRLLSQQQIMQLESWAKASRERE